MPKIVGAFSYRRRSKTNKTYILSLYFPCGLPPEICRQWQRKSLSRFPPELSQFPHPSSGAIAKNGALALIEFLKKEVSKGTVQRLNARISGTLSEIKIEFIEKLIDIMV